jgi:hypothetical protein
MVEQIAGVFSVAGLVLAYVLLLEAMTAAILVLAQFTVAQVRALRTTLALEWSPPAPPTVDAQPTYQLGGGLKKWD